MINFEEELKKFHPSLEVEEAEDAIYNRDLTDAADILVKMIKDAGADSAGLQYAEGASPQSGSGNGLYEG